MSARQGTWLLAPTWETGAGAYVYGTLALVINDAVAAGGKETIAFLLIASEWYFALTINRTWLAARASWRSSVAIMRTAFIVVHARGAHRQRAKQPIGGPDGTGGFAFIRIRGRLSELRRTTAVG